MGSVRATSKLTALFSWLAFPALVVICEYLDEKFPNVGEELYGKTIEEKAEVRMWLRRIDFNLEMPILNGFRFAEGKPLFEHRIKVIPQAADDLKAIGRERTAWIDGILADGRKWLCGDRLTLADFWLYTVLDFGASVGQPINPEAKNVIALMERLKSRPSIVNNQ